MYPPKKKRFGEFIDRLKGQSPARSRQEAVSLMQTVMAVVEDANGLPANDYSHRMNVFSLEVGWCDLESDPCYWDDAVSRTHRTEVYNSGRIVITYMREPKSVVLDKPGLNSPGKPA